MTLVGPRSWWGPRPAGGSRQQPGSCLFFFEASMFNNTLTWGRWATLHGMFFAAGSALVTIVLGFAYALGRTMGNKLMMVLLGGCLGSLCLLVTALWHSKVDSEERGQCFLVWAAVMLVAGAIVGEILA